MQFTPSLQLNIVPKVWDKYYFKSIIQRLLSSSGTIGEDTPIRMDIPLLFQALANDSIPRKLLAIAQR